MNHSESNTQETSTLAAASGVEPAMGRTWVKPTFNREPMRDALTASGSNIMADGLFCAHS